MAQGTQDLNLWEELPFHSASTITVLSWNIKGESGSIEEPRQILVPRVVNHVNPDVLLLQEIPSNEIINTIRRTLRGRTYASVEAGIMSEARVVYDSRVLEPLPEVNLDDMVASVFPPEQEGLMRGVQQTFRSRVAAVRLKHKDTGRVIVFLSFHNVYKGVYINMRVTIHRTVTATTFCQIVSADTWPDDTLVVGGADLNCTCDNFHRGEALVPQYRQCRRQRKGKDEIDYYVAKKDDITLDGSVFALNSFSQKRFRLVWKDVKSNTRFTWKQFDESLDHDPLVYKLTLYE